MKTLLTALVLLVVLTACGKNPGDMASGESHASAATGDYERGPHRGRMLRDGDFAIEVTMGFSRDTCKNAP